MVINFVEESSSTQTELIEMLRLGVVKPPFALVAAKQTDGVGSRGNSWIGAEGNLAFSFCVNVEDLPSDLPLNSASIYFAFLMVLALRANGSQIWLKWPNDFYLSRAQTAPQSGEFVENVKIGGLMTTKIGSVLICGIGLNLVYAPSGCGVLDAELSYSQVVSAYIKELEKNISWKQIFRNFSLEFWRSCDFKVHLNDSEVSLKEAVLQDDGSIVLNGVRVFSAR